MKLYRVVFETEIMILAEDKNEAISNAGYYVREESPQFKFSDLVETMYELNQSPDWKGCIPYSAKKGYNPDEKRCEEFLVG
jgi:hypothetical protein